MPALRPLPARPSLEFEHKTAKALVRQLHAGDPEALARARARHPAMDVSAPARIRLADAQLVIAREYGFASWPRLVRYFGDAERQRYARRWAAFSHTAYEAMVRQWLAAHRDRRAWVGRALAAYVPRFYGSGVGAVFDVVVTEDEVRLAVARLHGCPSWELLLARATEAEARQSPSDRELAPVTRAERAIAAADLPALQRVVEAHPELLQPSADDAGVGREALLDAALRQEAVTGVATMRPIVDWLVAQGLDLQRALNLRLCGHMHMSPASVRHLLDRGADPNWVAPNGIPVLEHALLRYWNGDAVDVLAARATPREALWIAAGLGDVAGVRRFLDGDGRPTPAARRLRPDFDAVGPMSIPSLPDPDDEELLVEVLFVAMLNGRTAMLDYLVARGAPVDSRIYGSPLINVAVGNRWTAMVECLAGLGADLDARGWQPNRSAREIARELFEQRPEDAERRRIVELCGMDPDTILAERAAKPVNPPSVDSKLQEALALAADDALRVGQSEVRPENLLFGLLRSGGEPLAFFIGASRMDVDRFRLDHSARVRPGEVDVSHPPLPLHRDAQAALLAATGAATERRHVTVGRMHLLWALTRDRGGPIAELLARYESSAAVLHAELEREL